MTSEVIVKFRPYAVAVATLATAAVNVAVLAPANAAATDPVGSLSAASQSQVGQDDVISASWTANDTATTYRMYLSDQADGSTVLQYQDVTGTSASISTHSLAPGATYYLAVKSTAPGASATTTPFTALTLDTTGPTGTFAADHTTRYLQLTVTGGTLGVAADFHITQSALADDTTAPAAITRQVVAGDGSAAKPWTSGTNFTLTYTKVGTFTPHVLLTDQFGNTTDKVLSTLTVAHDTTAPRDHITLPASPSRIASWRVIRGTASDAGTGIAQAATMVIERRGGIWYAYDFGHRTWLKGWASMTRTLNRSKAEPAFMNVSAAGAWRTPAIRGLTRGVLHVESVAFDRAFNVGQAPNVTRVIH
jgi:hypothetical protein